MNNLELANQEACKYDGVLLRDSDEGEIWSCVGLLLAADDIYYEMVRRSDRKRLLLSFVGDLDSYGFSPAESDLGESAKAPTQQQLNDPVWWDENVNSEYRYCAVKDGKLAGFSREAVWTDDFTYIPRPKSHPNDTQPSGSESQMPVEWDGGGLPPVGWKGEVKGSLDGCEIVAEWRGGRVYYNEFTENFGWTDSGRVFQPIRTQAEREREDLTEFLRSFDKQRSIAWCEDAADAIIAAGWRKGE